MKTQITSQMEDIRSVIVQELATHLSASKKMSSHEPTTSVTVSLTPPPSKGPIQNEDIELPSPSMTTVEPPPIGNHEEVECQALLTPARLTELFVKSCSRRNLAVRMVRDLFDEQTRINSNVNGKKKERLDPEIIKYIKQKCFYYWPLSGKETEDEGWKLCIISMDENSRSLKNKPRKATH